MNWDDIKRLLAPLGFIAFLSSIAGLSMMLRNKEDVAFKDWAGAILGSTAAGIIVYLLLQEPLAGQPERLLGVCCLAGAGGASTLDLLYQLGQRWISDRMEKNKEK